MAAPRIRFALFLPILVVAVGLASAQAAERPWQLDQHRMIQTNLREIDATMDLDRYIREIKELGADVVLFNVGGIVANYPSELEFEYVNPYMQGDMTQTVLDRLHAEDIRVIGRFDFSKCNEKFAEAHPEWLYVSEKGEHVNYNGQVHTCVSGGYQQEYMFEILGEAIDRYPLDGVFFNMIGYQRSDYSGNQHGVCQCENCKRLFKEYSGGEELPATNDGSPLYRKYVEFTRMMVDRQFNRVQTFLREKRPDLAICTYTSTGVDVIRKESNHTLGQGPFFDTEKAKWTMRTCGERQLANAAVHFIRIPYRHSAVSPQLTTRRLWQNMVNGAWLDFYCIGPLQRQEDRTGLDLVGKIFRFHEANERWIAPTVPGGEIAIVKRGGAEYDGLLQILAERHIPFELIPLEEDALKPFKKVLVPHGASLTEAETGAIDAYVRQGGHVILTGGAPEGLQSLGEPKLVEKLSIQQGGYIRIRPEDKAVDIDPLLAKLDLLFLKGDFYVYEVDDSVLKFMRLIPPDMFGPPEKCYYRHVSEFPALITRDYGRGSAAAFAFDIGTHYAEQGHQGHAAIVAIAVDHAIDRRVMVTTSPLVEVNSRVDRDGRFEWVSLYNHSGQLGVALHEPLPIKSIAITVRPTGKVKAVRSLMSGAAIPATLEADGRVSTVLPRLDRYDIVLFEYE